MRVLALVVVAIVPLGLGSCGKDEEALPIGSPPIVPNWAEEQGFAGNKQAERGAEIFAQMGCLSCHTYLGAGASNLGAPDLTTIGRDKPRSADQYATYLSDPSKFGNTVMPKFKDAGRRNLLAVGAFLQASKGKR